MDFGKLESRMRAHAATHNYKAAEDNYLRQLGHDPETLTREQRKTILFAYRYGANKSLTERLLKKC